MDSALLQDWITVTGDATSQSSSVPQPAALWLDVGDASDLTLFLEVSTKSGTPRLFYETSALKDGTTFQALLSSFAFPANTTNSSPRVDRLSLYQNPSVALARYLRWRIYSDIGSTWSVTFRVTALAYRR